MRIIDKNTDYYDYLSNVYIDDTLTFDRRGSYILKKDNFAKFFYYPDYLINYIKHGSIKNLNRNDDYYVLMQICNSFWLFNVKATSYDDNYVCNTYEIKLLLYYKNFDIKRVLFKMVSIDFKYNLLCQIEKHGYTDKVLETIKSSVSNNDYIIRKDINKNNGIPILKEIGITECVNPLDIYLSFEEYFSLEKTSLERTESIGITDNDKITNHGFDIKTSFRGNKKK